MSQFISGLNGLLFDYCHATRDSLVLFVFANDISSSDGIILKQELVKESLRLLPKLISIGEGELAVSPSSALHKLDAFEIVIIFSRTKSALKNPVLSFLQSGNSNGTRVYRVFDFSIQLFENAFRLSQRNLDRLNQLIINAASSTALITILSESGTHLDVRIDSAYHWTNSCGIFDGRFPGILPPGEVNTFPGSVDGRLVCDGALNSSIGLPFDNARPDQPLEFEIVNSEVVNITTASPIMRHFFSSLSEINNTLLVGEAGFGTNPGCQDFVPFCSHLNERHPGFHLGLGTPTQLASKVGWSCPIHVDLIPSKVHILFDARMVFDGYMYLEDALLEIGRSAEPAHILHADAI